LLNLGKNSRNMIRKNMFLSTRRARKIPRQRILKVLPHTQVTAIIFVLENISLVLGIPDLHPADPDAQFATCCAGASSVIYGFGGGGYFFCWLRRFSGDEWTLRVNIMRSNHAQQSCAARNMRSAQAGWTQKPGRNNRGRRGGTISHFWGKGMGL